MQKGKETRATLTVKMALRVVTSHLHSDVMLSSSSPTTLLTSSMTFPAQIRQRRASKALSGFNLLGFGTGSMRRRDLGVVVVASSNAAASEPWEAFTPDKASGACFGRLQVHLLLWRCWGKWINYWHQKEFL